MQEGVVPGLFFEICGLTLAEGGNYEGINDSDKECDRWGNVANSQYQAREGQTNHQVRLRTKVLWGPYCTDLRPRCCSVCRLDSSIRIAGTF
jgi:hypothetical protein